MRCHRNPALVTLADGYFGRVEASSPCSGPLPPTLTYLITHLRLVYYTQFFFFLFVARRSNDASRLFFLLHEWGVARRKECADLSRPAAI